MRKKLSALASSQKMYAATRPPAPRHPVYSAVVDSTRSEERKREKKSPGEHIASTWAPAALVPSLVKKNGSLQTRRMCCPLPWRRSPPFSPSANLKWRLSARRGRASCRWALPVEKLASITAASPLNGRRCLRGAAFIVLECSAWVTPPFRRRGSEVGCSSLEAQGRHRLAQGVFFFLFFSLIVVSIAQQSNSILLIVYSCRGAFAL